MKTISKLILLSVFTGIIFFSQAQTKIKLGNIDSGELLKMMPGRDSAEAKMKEYAKTLESQFQAMQTELESKYSDLDANKATMSDLIKQMKQKEIEDLSKRIQDFQQSAQEDVQKKEQELLQPIIAKAKKAIEDVAKENGYTYIFDRSTQVLLYFDASEDILALVKKKLGLK